ncbi:unnamed protein product [Rangifer tarandus platyrhynchus]|uniref:Secreted protein n=1 Tax=Rangifer tarandus platyrhynchus TaxID=3082113 RepID=A0ABN9A329_RANTA|nr:unnamed protein product [Rangifer tarandus platyrhynchus]
MPRSSFGLFGINLANQGILFIRALEQVVATAWSSRLRVAFAVLAASELPAQSSPQACVFPLGLVPFPRLLCWGVSGQR